jgi:RNAse (barnase) inhibitor barstar
MRNLAGMFDEFMSEFEFPDYFGRNWAALTDCLSDLLWLGPVGGVVLVVTEPQVVLIAEERVEMDTLVLVLGDVQNRWTAGATVQQQENQVSGSFDVILSVDSNVSMERARTRWEASGAVFVPPSAVAHRAVQILSSDAAG